MAGLQGWQIGRGKTVIKQDDLIGSVADALQFISYYHLVDFIRAMRKAYEREESPAAKAALTQVLVNSRMCALGKRPICQDTGIVNVFMEVGMEVSWEGDLRHACSDPYQGPKIWSAKVAERIQSVEV
ncbi:MAG: fumarate hydratase [Pseudomonadales bacterium]|jgi:tartrate dehydratase alpha subunit/fumarate hydratase class I-like protein